MTSITNLACKSPIVTRRLGSSEEVKDIAKIERKAIKDTKEELSDLPKKFREPEKPQTVDTGIDSQQDFIRNIQEKLEDDYKDKLSAKEKQIIRLDVEIEKMKMNEYNLDDYQTQRVRALTKVMQEVMKDDYRPDRNSIAKLFGLDEVIRDVSNKEQPISQLDDSRYNQMQIDLNDRLDQERREFRTKEIEIEKNAYQRAKQEFEIESKKMELDRRQREIEDQKRVENEYKLKQENEKKLDKKRLSVGSDINPVSIAPSPQKQKKSKNCLLKLRIKTRSRR